MHKYTIVWRDGKTYPHVSHVTAKSPGRALKELRDAHGGIDKVKLSAMFKGHHRDIIDPALDELFDLDCHLERED